MSKWGHLTLTHKGAALLAKLQVTGATMNMSKIKFGDGIHDDTVVLAEMVDLLGEKQTVGISSKDIVDDTTCKFTCIITNTGLANGYYLRECGLYAMDPDDGEILYATNYDDIPDYLPNEADGPAVYQEFSIYVTVSDAANVVLDVNFDALAKKANSLEGYGIYDSNNL